MSVIQVDVRELAPAQRHPLILESFHSFEPGQAIVNHHGPKPLYYQFSAEYPDQFEWKYLEEGPETWRVKITKNSAPMRGAFLLRHSDVYPYCMVYACKWAKSLNVCKWKVSRS